MDRAFFELRLAVRRLLSQPGFSVIAVLSLAVGIGASTIFFSLMNATLLKPLPIDRPGEVYSVIEPRFGAPVVSYPNFKDLRERNTVLAGMVAYRIAPMNASLGSGRNGRMWGYLVSGDYFEVLGVQASLGRALTPADNLKRGGHPVAVLSHLAWQRRFGGDPGVINRTIKLNGFPFTILGVLPPGFNGLEKFYAAEVFVPDTMSPQIEPGSNYMDQRSSQNTFIAGRLKPGVSKEQAEAGLNSIARQLAVEYPKENEGMVLRLVAPGWAGAFMRTGVIVFSTLLLSVAALLLLVVCINLASLMLARASERRKETAIRLAIGANRWQLLRQLLLESLVVTVIGGAAGMLLAFWGVALISALKPPVDFSFDTTVRIDYTVLAFTSLLTLVTSLLLGLLPAWQSTRTDLVTAIKNDAVTARERRWPLRDVLVGGQIALSVVLLGASGLMLQSLQRALTVNLGFEPRGAAALGFNLAFQGYSEERGIAFQKQFMDKIRALPEVESAAFASYLPLDLGMNNNGVYPDGQPTPSASQMPTAQSFEVSPAYFRTMRTKLLAGREFDDRDGPNGPRAIIINATLARKILKLKDPTAAIGKRLRTGSGAAWEVIGVAEDGKYFALSEAPKPAMFFSNLRRYTENVRVVARTSADPRLVLNRMREIVLSLEPDMALYDPETMEEHLRLPLLPTKFAAWSLASFGSVTMLLAAIGIYGVMAYAVARRTREIGIRMAIGASRGQVATVIFRRMSWIFGIAGLTGVALAMLIGGAIAPVLIGVNPRDPLVHLGSVAIMAAVALAACWVPARRAMAIDPLLALRQD